ncbi:4-hydroxy-tetrahydrodipicolinate reductase [Desulfovibrionales bacterium]
MATKIVVTGVMGRMGSTIMKLVDKDPDLELAGVVEQSSYSENLKAFVCPQSTSLDEVLPQAIGAVVVDFTTPKATVEAARAAARHGNPLVVGTTGLTSEQLLLLEEAATCVPVLWSPNMSIGVNVLLRILPDLVRLLGEVYDIEVMELHHNQKKDSPSGTALKLAECLATSRGWNFVETSCYARHGIVGARPRQEIGVQAIRGGDVVGVHTVYFMGPGERIEVTHQAHSRENFAQGALRAAKWLVSRSASQLYTFADIL